MIHQSLSYQWLGPAILISAAVALLCLYFHDRRHTAAVKLAGAYFIAAIGFTQIMLVGGNLSLSNPLVIHGSLFGSHFFLAWGMFSLYGRSFPKLFVGMAILLTSSIVLYTMTDASLYWLRVTADYGFIALIDIVCGFLAWRGRRFRVDFVIVAIFLVHAAQTLLKIGQLYLPGSAAITPETFGTFYLAAMMQTLNAFHAIALAIALFSRFFVSTLAKLTRLADTDPLTGLLNRRAFETAARELRAASAPLPTGLIICDIDHFKTINDCHGHETGDAALQAFARLLHELAGEIAICGRLGGEEFCILLAESDHEMTRLAAIRMRVAAERLKIPAPAGVLHLTASFGCCALESGGDLREAMAVVDAAVYQAKKDGRNLVRAASTVAPEQVAETLFLDRTRATG